jgi:transcriptional regulator with XRE-family HTH domain
VPDPITKIVAANVVRLRKARGWSQDRLCTEMQSVGCEWQRDVVAKVENGRRKAITVDELAALAGVFNLVNPWELTILPSCDTCGGAPPRDFICAICGKRGSRD